MRSILLFACLCIAGVCIGQGSGFSFSYTGPTQINVGQSCTAALNWGHPNTPTATSNIPGGFIVSFNIYSISGGYQIGDQVPGGTTVTVFYQAVDNFGNTALFGFTIAFVDTIPPTFDPTTLPQNLTVNCTGNFPIADVEIHDNCEDQDIVLTLTFAESNNAQPCTGGLITRTWLADDDLGNTAVFVQTITVLPDNTPPVIANTLQNGTAPCSTAMAQYSTWLTAQRAAFSATDAGCGVMTLSDNAPSPNTIQSFCGPIDVTFTAKDNCNNMSTVIRTFTVTNNVPPVITTPASDANGNCNQSNIQTIFNNWISSHGGAAAMDDCSGVIWSTNPASPTLSVDCDNPITVMFIAGDGCGNADTTTATFTLTDDTPPTITTDPTSMILSCSSATVDSLLNDWLNKHGMSTGQDLCTSTSDLVKGFSIKGTPLSLEEVLSVWQDSLNGDCHDDVFVNGVGINNVKAYIEVNFTYTDRCGNTGGKVGVFGITDNGRPIFETPPRDTSFTCSQSSSWQDVFTGWYSTAGGATYTDICSDVIVTANITADSAMQIIETALDSSCDQGVSLTLTFTLTDECGNVSTTSPAATFSLGDSIPPGLITPASDFEADCSGDGQLQLNNWLDTLGGASADDGCGVLTWTFTWTDTSGMILTGIPDQGPHPDITTLNCGGGFVIIFTATDVCQNSVSDTALFSISDNIPPIFFITEDTVRLGCNESIPETDPPVTDNCGGAVTITYEDLEGEVGCLGVPAEVIRIYTATDACGNTSIESIVFERNDTTPPTFDLPPDTVSFCSVDTLSLINLADDCDQNPSVSFTDVITGEACQQQLRRTWVATDDCGNSTSAVQQFDLSDETAPTINVSPGTFVYTCAEGSLQEAYEGWLASVEIFDGCSEADYFIARPGSYDLADTSTWPGISLPDSVMLTCDEDLLINGDLVVFDACGNVSVEEISFSVNDTTAPVFLNCIPVLSVEPDTAECNGLVHLEQPDILETCFPNDVTVSLTLNGNPGIPLPASGALDTTLRVGVHIAEWTATDCKGNTSTCTTRIEIIDENALVLTCPTDTLIYSTPDTCTASIYIKPPVTSSGKCALGVVELRFEIIGKASPDSVVFTSPEDSVLVEFMVGFQNVLLIARDSTGDIDTCSYFVIMADTIDPVIQCRPDTVFLHPSGVESFDLANAELLISADDNCAIHMITYDPPMFDCSLNGSVVDVTVTATDFGSNSSICVTAVTVMTQPLIPLWEQGLCDDTLRLYANIPPGPMGTYTYQWTGPNGFNSTEENPVIPGADSTYSGTYTLVVTSENGCISTGSMEVIVQSLVAPLINADDTMCLNETSELTTQTYSGIVSYQWHQISPAGDTTVINTEVPSLAFTPVDTGTYVFFAQVIQDTCISLPSPDVSVYVAPIPDADIAPLEPAYCIADTLFLQPAVSDSTLVYQWMGPGGFNSNEITPGGIPVIEIDSPYVFYLVVNDGLCSTSADSVTVNIQLPPETPVIEGDTLGCEGGSVTLTTSAQGSTYVWLTPAGDTVSTSQNEITITPVSSMDEGVWSVIVFEGTCPSLTSPGFNVSIDTALTIEVVAPMAVCEGDSITLSVVPGSPGEYTWSGPGGFTSSEIAPTVLANEGTYTVSIASTTGCNATDSITISVDALPQIISLQSDAPDCANGESAVRLWTVTEPASDQFIYNWSGPGGFMSQDSSPVISNFDSSLNGIYQLFIQNGVCHTDTQSLEIKVVDGPAAPVITGDNVYCFGDTIQLGIENPIPGASYTWTTNDTILTVESPGDFIITDATNGLTGIYRVVVTIGECTSAESSIAIQVKAPLLIPEVTAPTLVCEGDSLVLTSTAPSGAIVHWMGPNGFTSDEANPVIYPAMPSDAGEYLVYYELNGCLSDTSQVFNIKVQSTIATPSLHADVSAVCITDPGEVNICITPGTETPGGVYTYYLNGAVVLPGSDSCITLQDAPLISGDNFISVTASLQGCPSDTSADIVITGDLAPKLQANAGADIAICPGEEIILNALDAPPASGAWSSFDDLVVFDDEVNPNTTVGPLPPGIYYMTWTLSYASCVNYSSDSVEVEIVPAPIVFPDTVNVPFGITEEFIVTLNDSITGIPYTLEVTMPATKGNALHAGNGIFRYTPNIGFVGTDMLRYRVCSTDCPGECSETFVVIRVGDEDDCFVPTLFTPNDDGINDRLIVPCLETARFPDNEIIIFNEWGDVVYKAAPYLNDWNGRVSGNALPVGTYFYIMDFGDGSTPRRSFLVLER